MNFLEDYLRNNIDYDLGPRHIEGLQRFYELAKQENLIPGLDTLRFLSQSSVTST